MTADFRLDPLWLRLAFLERQGGPSAPTLLNLVRSEAGWPAERTRQVVEEYRRFLFLAMRAGHSIAPPPDIARVWELHLAHAPNYWDVLGDFISERPVVATSGSGAETTASYRAIFGEDPPPEIWTTAPSGNGPRWKSWLSLVLRR